MPTMTGEHSAQDVAIVTVIRHVTVRQRSRAEAQRRDHICGPGQTEAIDRHDEIARRRDYFEIALLTG